MIEFRASSALPATSGWASGGILGKYEDLGDRSAAFGRLIALPELKGELVHAVDRRPLPQGVIPAKPSEDFNELFTMKIALTISGWFGCLNRSGPRDRRMDQDCSDLSAVAMTRQDGQDIP